MDKFRTDIADLLKSLNFQKLTFFAGLTCEKLYPNYLFFANKYDLDGSIELQDAIASIFQLAYLDTIFSDDDIMSMINEIELLMPDTEDFDTITASFALDACTSVVSTLNFILDKDVENIVDVATYARDTVDMFIQERDNLSLNDKDIELKIQNDHLMIRERTRQVEIINGLRDSKEISDKLLNNLRLIQPNSIIDISQVT